MRARVERELRAHWAGEERAWAVPLDVALRPLEAAWRAGAWLDDRRRWGRAPTRVEGIGVVSIGNVAVGGTGKTPFVAWMVEALERSGVAPAIVTGRRGHDEQGLHRRWTRSVPVLGGRDRVAGVRAARSAGADVAVLDDGFQHRPLARDLDVVLLAVEDGLPGPRLPRGPFREGAAALRRADVVLLTRRSATVEEARRLEASLKARLGRACPPIAGCVRLVPDRLETLERWREREEWAPGGRGGGGEGPGPAGGREPDGRGYGGAGGALAGGSEEIRTQGVLAVSAIARPASFERDVARTWCAPVEGLSFADHHAFTRGDALRIRARAAGRPVVMTEKDAVKLAAFAADLGPAWVLRQDLSWDWGEEAVVERVERLVEERAWLGERNGRPDTVRPDA